MRQNPETIIGINVGKVGREDRGISVYTRNILRCFGGVNGNNCRFRLLHYHGDPPKDKLGIDSAELEALWYSDKHKPIRTIINEQILGPIQQQRLGLDVVWHPHNRCQFFSPEVAHVSSMHDVLPIARPDLATRYLGPWDKKLLYLSRTMPARYADMIITASDFSKKEIVKFLGVDPKKVVTIYSGIDNCVFNPNKQDDEQTKLRLKYHLPNRYLLTTGSYAPHKNLDILVEAYYQSHLRDNRVGLVMVGPNDATGYRIGYQQVTEHVRKLGISENVRLLPSVSIEDLLAIYRGATMFTITSQYEGFGFTPLEAMACGTPVVASNTSSIPEVCGPAALYANPNDPSEFADRFNLLSEDTELGKRLVTDGQLHVRKFSWKDTANKTLDVLKGAALQQK